MKDAYKTAFDDSPNATLVISSDSEITFLWSITVSIYLFAGMISGAFSGAIVDFFGR